MDRKTRGIVAENGCLHTREIKEKGRGGGGLTGIEE